MIVKTLVVMFLLAPPLCGALSAQDRVEAFVWPENLPKFVQKGIEEAKAQKKLMLLNFGADWCGPCKLMDRKTFPNPRVRAELESWVVLRVDADEHRELARAFSVSVLPAYLAVNQQGGVLDKRLGYVVAVDFAEWLAAARKAR